MTLKANETASGNKRVRPSNILILEVLFSICSRAPFKKKYKIHHFGITRRDILGYIETKRKILERQVRKYPVHYSVPILTLPWNKIRLTMVKITIVASHGSPELHAGDEIVGRLTGANFVNQKKDSVH